MLTKLATFRGVSDQGEPLIHLFDPGVSMVKQAGEMMPVIKNWLDAYKPDPNKIAVLVNALGASEYWGQNVNGDIFPESALVHDCANHPGEQHPYDDFTGKIIPPYGAWTFMHAHPFVHHKNKDPNRAFGKVVLWAWNPKMHRVELIILLDKNLALQHGAQHVIDRILAGEFPDVSMGCKVPYDICSICGHKSKTRKDYCNCIRYIGMGKILDDGRKIGVINTYPRFFDISFVFIGADKTAKVMCKLGSGAQLPQSIIDAELVYGADNEDGRELVKAASVQVPSNLYTADLEKTALRPPRSRGEIMDFYVKRAEPRIAGVSAEKSDQILAGRVDHQENPERRAIADGTVKTNADVNESDEFPEPLMPSRGKTASALKQLILDSRMEKTSSPWLHAGLGAALGGGTGAYLAEDRLKGGLAGAAAGSLAGLGFGAAAKRAGTGTAKKWVDAFEKHVQTNAKKTIRDMRRVEGKQERVAERIRDLSPFKHERAVAEKARLEKEVLPKLKSQQDDLNKKLEGLWEGWKSIPSARKGAPGVGSLMGAGSAAAGGFGAGGLAGEAFQEKNAADGMSDLWEKCKKIKIGPPPKPNRKEYPFTGTIDFRGLMIHVENKPGTYREGKGWRTLMKMPYGEFLGTKGVDKDKLDVYVGPYRNAPNVYIIHQNKVRGPQEGNYDEDKVMLGFESLDQAKAAYLAHYDSDKYYRSATVMAFPLFKRAIMKKEVHGEKVASAEKNADVYAIPIPSGTKGQLALAGALGVGTLGTAAYMRLRNRKQKEEYARKHQAKLRQKQMGKTASRSEYVSIMEKRAEDLRLEDLFSGGKTAGRRSKVWRHSDGRELKRTGSGMDDWDQVKLASKSKYAALDPQELLKVSAEKWADIVKHIGPDKAVGKVTPVLSETEPTLPKETLDAMADQGMESALATPSLMGMVLKPEEFQRVCLKCMGKDDLADKLDDAGAVFKPSEGEMAPCHELSSDQLSPELMKLLLPLMGEKSYLGPVVRRRIIRITISKPEPLTKSTEVNSPLLSKVASAYNWYRREQMKLAADTMEVVPNNPDLHSGLYGIGDEDLFGKIAAPMSLGVDGNTLAVVLGSIPISLMYSAHLRGERRKGKEMGLLKNLVADHPWLATVGTAAGLREVMKSPQAKQFVNEIMQAGKRIIKGAPVAR